MNYWNLTNDEIELYKPIIESYLRSSDSNINLTNSGLNISKLKSLLKLFDYKETDFDSNGFQFDFWIYFSNISGELPDLVIFGTGYTFELYLGFKNC